jgi:hypothetical protein
MSRSQPSACFRLRPIRAVLLAIVVLFSAIGLAPDLFARSQVANTLSPQEFVGTWVLHFEGKDVVILKLKLSGSRLGGTLTLPQQIQLDADGGINHVSSEVREKPVLETVVSGESLKIKVGSPGDSDDFVFQRIDHDHGQLQLKLDSDLSQPWRLLRLDVSQKAAGGAKLESPQYSPEIVALQAKLEEMAKRDQAVRKEVPMLASKLKAVDEGNYPELVRIYEKYKWPLISAVGKDAAHDYWLLVQHQELAFQERLLPEMRQAADTGQASKVEYAYLYDRVMSEEGKPQHWGTQSVCRDGKAALLPVDDPEGLQQRRKDLHIFPMDQNEYLRTLDSQCANFKNDTPASASPHP